MIKPQQIVTIHVTDAQIGMCRKVIHTQGNFYMVTSESDATKEYKVTYSKEHGFQCSCEAGQHGFTGCTTAASQGVCKHVRWSVAAAREERAYMTALADRQAQELAEQERRAKQAQQAREYAAMCAEQNADPRLRLALNMSRWNR